MAKASKKNSKPPEFVSTKKLHAKPDWLEIRFNDLIKRIEGKKKVSQATEKITLSGLSPAEYESIVDGLKRAGKAGYLKEDINTLRKVADRFDDDSTMHLVKTQWAKEAIPAKGVKPKHYRECAKRLGVVVRKGKQEFYNPKEVLEYHQRLIRAFKDKNKKLSTAQKQSAVCEVAKQFQFASEEAARQYLTRHKAKDLPWKK